jgi:hypothetical protein
MSVWVEGVASLGDRRMGPLKEEFLKWQGWMNRIKEDIGERLVVPRHVYRKLVEVANANLDHITKYSGWHFVKFVRHGYAAQVAVGIRRHVKDNKDSISLMRLLREVRDNAPRFTYQFFLEQFPVDENYVPWQKPTFGRFSDDGITVSSRILNEDTENLKTLAKNVEDFVDKDVAHLDKKPRDGVVTFGDLERCIDELNRLVCKYRTLFGGGGMSTLEPTILSDWEDIFGVPLDVRGSAKREEWE